MSSLFHHYKTYTDPTESPRSYHFWTAISVVSALLGRKCFINYGASDIYPQLYIILVGKPALGKTMAMRVGHNLITEVGKVPMAPSSSSKESLMDYMAEEGKVKYIWNGKECSYHQTYAIASEMATFFGEKHLNSSIVKFLTDLWDSPSVFTERTRKSKTVKVPCPYFSFLGGCPVEWVETQLSDDVFTSGFTRRALFVNELRAHHIMDVWPGLNQSQITCWPLIVAEAKRINSLNGNFTITESAKQLHIQERTAVRLKVDEGGFNSKVEGYYSSRDVIALKLYMCISAAFDSSRVISPGIVYFANRVLSVTEERLEDVFRAVGRNIFKPLSDRILDRVRLKPTSQVELFTYFYGNGLATYKELDEIAEGLDKLGLVKRRIVGTEIMYESSERKKTSVAVDLLAEACKLDLKAEPVKTSMMESLMRSLEGKIDNGEYDDEL